MSMSIFFYLDKSFIIYCKIIYYIVYFSFLYIYSLFIHSLCLLFFILLFLYYYLLFFLFFATHWFTVLLSEKEKITRGIITAEGKKNFLGTSARDNANPAEDID